MIIVTNIYRIITAILSQLYFHSYRTLAKVAVSVSIEATTWASIEITVEQRNTDSRPTLWWNFTRLMYTIVMIMELRTRDDARPTSVGCGSESERFRAFVTRAMGRTDRPGDLPLRRWTNVSPVCILKRVPPPLDPPGRTTTWLDPTEYLRVSLNTFGTTLAPERLSTTRRANLSICYFLSVTNEMLEMLAI